MAKEILLGKQTGYSQTYNPDILFPVARSEKRKDISYDNNKINGYDVWGCYEVSVLNEKGQPQNFIGILSYTCKSKYIIESKSLKLYLNSFNMTKFKYIRDFENTVIKDIGDALESDVIFYTYSTSRFNDLYPVKSSEGMNIDSIVCDDFKYEVDSKILNLDAQNNILHINSELLRSNCLVTGQPDWGTIEIYIEGQTPTIGSLLKYIISFRNHQEFHEQCIERIISTLIYKFDIEKCFVKGNYVRRGGIDINPIRCYNMPLPTWSRTCRQ